MLPAFIVLLRCDCGHMLVTENECGIDFNFGQVVVYKDTGRVRGRCRQCGRPHELPGYEIPLCDVALSGTFERNSL